MSKMKVQLTDLRISLENPRLELMANYSLAIKEMISNQQNKIYELAKDICKNGLNPHSTIAVYPCEYEKGKFCVAEGNRRTLAMQLVFNPNVIKDIDNNLYNKFLDLHNSYNLDIFSELEVNYYDSIFDPQLVHWLEVIHNGQNDGRGVVPWSGEQKERFGERFLNKQSPLLTFQEDLIAQKILSPEQVKEVSKTNWERILGKVCLDFLLINKQNGLYFLPPNDEIRVESIRRIQAMINRLRNKTVSIVYDDDAKIKLIDDLKIELDIEDEDQAPTLLDFDESTYTKANITKENNSANISLKNKNARQKGIPAYKFQNLKITSVDQKISDNTGIFNVCYELKSLCKSKYNECDCEKYPIATLMLIRSLFESSIKYWLKNRKETIWKHLTSNNPTPLLSKILEKISSSIENGHEVFNKELDERFEVEFGKKGTHKTFLDLIVHYPETFSKNYNNDGMIYEIYMIANSLIFNIIEFILNN